VSSKSFVAALCLCIALVCVAPASWAHHSGAMFDKTRTIQIHGVVKEFLWTNPHASFKVEVPGAGGEPQLWLIEMNAPGNLVHEGWKRNTIKPGDQVTVTVNPLRDGRPGGWYVAIKLADGSSLQSIADPAGSAPPPAPGP
jgi:hypothetical protein